MISTREREIFDYIVQYKRENDGLAPTFRQIMASTSVTSTSLTGFYLRRLERAGLIQFIEGKHHGIMVTGGSWEYQADEMPVEVAA